MLKIRTRKKKNWVLMIAFLAFLDVHMISKVQYLMVG